MPEAFPRAERYGTERTNGEMMKEEELKENTMRYEEAPLVIRLRIGAAAITTALLTDEGYERMARDMNEAADLLERFAHLDAARRATRWRWWPW